VHLNWSNKIRIESITLSFISPTSAWHERIAYVHRHGRITLTAESQPRKHCDIILRETFQRILRLCYRLHVSLGRLWRSRYSSKRRFRKQFTRLARFSIIDGNLADQMDTRWQLLAFRFVVALAFEYENNPSSRPGPHHNDCRIQSSSNHCPAQSHPYTSTIVRWLVHRNNAWSPEAKPPLFQWFHGLTHLHLCSRANTIQFLA
jgi:hypothetical protein